MRVLLLFVDGVGLGDDVAATNPFLTARTPVITALLDGAPVTHATSPRHAARASLVPVDATLGVDGTPQSGTGQAALLTGVDAVALHGRHFGPWVPARLRTLVRERNVLTIAVGAGRSVAFANAYPQEVLQQAGGDGAALLPSDAGAADGSVGADDAAGGAVRPRRSPAFLKAGPPLAALGAGLLNRHAAALMTGDAVASEITNDGWRDRLGRTELPVIDAHRAGRNLAAIVARHDLTLFAHYATDYAGHKRDMAAAVQALERLDIFIGGLVEGMTDDTVVLVVSDHGNIEDITTGHTRNPAIGLIIGARHEEIAATIHSLTDIAPAILTLLEPAKGA